MTFDEIIKSGKLDEICNSGKSENAMADELADVFKDLDDKDETAKDVSPLFKGKFENDIPRTRKVLTYLQDKVLNYKGDKKDTKRFGDAVQKQLNALKKVDQLRNHGGDCNSKEFENSLKTFWYNFGEHYFVRTSSMASIGSDKEEDFKQVLAKANPATSAKFINEIKDTEMLLKIDAARWARNQMVITGKLDPNDKNFPDPSTDVKNMKEQLKHAENIKKAFSSLYEKGIKLLNNEYTKGIEGARDKLAKGNDMVDPITGEKVFASDFKSFFSKNTKAMFDNFDGFLGKQKVDVVTIGPKIAMFLIKQFINPNSNTRHFTRAIHKMFDVSRKAADSKVIKDLIDKQSDENRIADDFDWKKYLYTYQATEDEFMNAPSSTKKETEKTTDEEKLAEDEQNSSKENEEND